MSRFQTLWLSALAVFIGSGGAGVLSARAVRVPEVQPIGAVQGAVSDDAVLTNRMAALTGRTVAVQGVAYEPVVRLHPDGSGLRGLLIQNTRTVADGDPRTSDGLYVELPADGLLPRPEGPSYGPVVGDELRLSGRVTTWKGQAHLVDVRLLELVRKGVDLEVELETADARPPDDAAAAAVYWERREGMRCRVPAGAIALGGLAFDYWDLFGETSLLRADHPVAQRTEPYARRVFRDAHPLDDRPEERFDNGNGFRIRIGDLGLRALADPKAAARGLPPVRTFDTLDVPLVGGVIEFERSYAIHPAASPVFRHGPRPDRNEPPVVTVPTQALVVATFNVENLYDFSDDPFDANDFARPGVATDAPRRLQNYVPASEEAYRAHVDGLARQIVGDLHCPDVILLQEVEDQDIRVGAEKPRARRNWVDNADGELDALSDLAAAVAARGGPRYRSACDRSAADERGIVCAFLYRTDRVRLAEPARNVAAGGLKMRGTTVLLHEAGFRNPRAFNTAANGEPVFSRPPQVACFEFNGNGSWDGTPVRFYAVVNHLKSNPGMSVELRRVQASFNAALAKAIDAAEPGAKIVLGGDMNVYPRPDDPEPGAPGDQLAALYEAGLVNGYDEMLKVDAKSAYTYVYQGMAQTLDQLFLSPSLHAALVDIRALHINSDWSNEPETPDRACSDHDPVRAAFVLQ